MNRSSEVTVTPAGASSPGTAPRVSVGEWWGLVKTAAAAWVADYAPSMGAALSYYTVFSLAPLLLIVISIAGLVFGEEAVRGEVFGQLQSLLGAEASKAVEGLLVSISDQPAQSIVSTLVGLALLLVGATTVFGELQDALDRIWRAPVRDRSGGLWGLLRARLLSFGMILGIAFLLMVSLVLSAALSALGSWWSGAFFGWEVLAQIVNMVLGFALTTGVFAMIYKIMPRVRVQWLDVWLGAAVTAGLFTIGRFLIGLYIGKSGVASAFGAAGSLVVVFVWVYYSAQIFLIGAEFTWVYSKTFGSMRHLGQDAVAKTPELIPAAGSAVGIAAPESVDASTGEAHPAHVAAPVAAPAPPGPPGSPAVVLPPPSLTGRVAAFGAGISIGLVAGHLVPMLTRRR